MSIAELESIIEAVLFAAGEAVELKNLAAAIEQDIKTTKAIVNNLSDKYKSEKRGVIIIEVGDSYQMCTNPDYFDYIKKLYESPVRKKLSPTVLETLAIIAYKQPITKGRIEEIRGVNADHAVNKLVEYGLVAEKGRADTPGRPILFGTTDDFLRHFGFNNLDAMPQTNNAVVEQLKIEVEMELKNAE